jgi:hypothetical protein
LSILQENVHHTGQCKRNSQQGKETFNKELLLPHDHTQATPPTFRQAAANHFYLGRAMTQQGVAGGMELQ